MMGKQWVLDKENYNESVKLTWLTCLFNEGFSQPMCKASLIFRWKDMEAVSRIEKQSSEHKDLHASDPLMWCKTCEFNEITNLRTSNKFMVSFDVESLFTNILLLESIELAVDYILSGKPQRVVSCCYCPDTFSIPREILRSDRWRRHGLPIGTGTCESFHRPSWKNLATTIRWSCKLFLP